VQGALKGTYDGLIAAAGQFGITGGQADALARKVLGVPDGVDINTWMGDEAKRMAEATKGAVDAIPTQKNILITYSDVGRDEAMARRVQATGGATGGRVRDLAGLAEGGKVPGTAPADLSRDNVLALVNGKPFGLQSEEWVINGRNSKKYDRELAAINAGTFPKLPGYVNGGRAGREYSAQSLGYFPAQQSKASSSGAVFGDVTITQQSDPVATWHEFSRRTNMRQT
jgi:hypothetical protein